jgi:hypothetical protein
MTWSERVAPGVAIMRDKANRQFLSEGEVRVAAGLIEEMARELDDARTTILAFVVFNLLLAISAGAYAWRIAA